MENPTILKLLEKQTNNLFEKFNSTSISGLYKEEYNIIKAGSVFVFDNGKRQMLKDLKALSKDTSHDLAFKNKLIEYLKLDNTSLIEYFENEFVRIFSEIINSKKQHEIQAIFIEYDFYYHYTSCLNCYGQQEYPLIEEPRYITNEIDFNKQIIFIENGINFQPAWISCEEFSYLDYLEIGLEELFQLHSRTLLHKALDNLNISGKLNLFSIRPFSFYINEHDSKVMMLYKLK
jgi:hypothetical protein